MKQREVNTILSNNAATSTAEGETFVNLRILDVGENVIVMFNVLFLFLLIFLSICSMNELCRSPGDTR